MKPTEPEENIPPELERYLAVCVRTYERLRDAGEFLPGGEFGPEKTDSEKRE